MKNMVKSPAKRPGKFSNRGYTLIEVLIGMIIFWNFCWLKAEP